MVGDGRQAHGESRASSGGIGVNNGDDCWLRVEQEWVDEAVCLWSVVGGSEWMW